MNDEFSATQSAQPLDAAGALPGAHPEPAAAAVAREAGRPARAWWRSRQAVYLALVAILLLGAYFRLLALTDWDSGTGQHPDERFFTDVTSLVRMPGSIGEYFDSARSPANPRNVGKTFFVYGTLPVMLTRLVAVTLTPDEALPAQVREISGPDGDFQAERLIPNPELALPRLTLLQEWFNPEGHNLTSYGWVNKVGRAVVVVFDLASILLVFLIAARLYDERVGLLAALLSALAVMAIQQSHFYVDPIFSTFFTLLALYWAVRVAQGGGAWSYSALGLSIGLAMASRITLMGLAVIAIFAALLEALVRVQAERKRVAAAQAQAVPAVPDPSLARSPGLLDVFLLRSLPLLCLAGLMTLLSFRIFHPYAFIGSLPDSPPILSEGSERLPELHGWGFLDMRPDPRFLSNMQTVRGLVTGEDDFPPSQQWVGRTAYLFPWQNMVLWGMGPVLGLSAWLAWALVGWLLLRRVPAALRGRAAAAALAPLVLWVWVAFYFGWQGGQFASTMRYMLPIYGALIIFAAWLLLWLWDWAAQRRQMQHSSAAVTNTQHGRLPRLLARARQVSLPAAPWLLVVVVLGTFAWAYAFTRIYTRPHSRVMAAHWLVQHVPPGARITSETWDDALPLQVAGGDPWGRSYRGVSTAPYAEDDPQKYFGDGQNPGLLDQLEEADYITLTSNRVYASTSRLRMRYPVLMRYYHHLFTGELGFKLVAEITSYPTLLGIPIPDQAAEEAFTVYDHPRVLIFEKTPEFSRERAEELITGGANWDEVYKSPVSLADRSDSALRIAQSDWPAYRSGGTWSAFFSSWSSVNSDLLAPLVWLLALEVLGLAAFALLFHLLPWLPDRGFSLARALALLLVAYAAWMLGSLGWLSFSPLAVWLCALPLLVGGAWVGWRSRAQLLAFVRQRQTALLTAQGIYLVAFFALVLLRWYNPDLWHPARGGEKPMDFAYLNAVLQSAAFPPYDPWFAGGYINYYYFGFVIVGTLVHLTSIVPSVAYNLAVATLFALTALGAWGAVYNLLAPRPLAPAPYLPPRRWRRLETRARTAALLAPFLMVLVGSLTQAIWYINGYAADNQHRPEWAFWDATRIVPGTVNEFPFFTFLFADLHAHMMVMPFSLLLVGLLVALVRRRSRAGSRQAAHWSMRPLFGVPLLVYLLLGLLAGTLRATNTWDYPTFMGLTGATLGLLAWRQFRRERARARAAEDDAALTAALNGGKWALVLLGQFALVLLLGNLLFWPFISHFATESTGVAFLREGLREGWLAQVLSAQRTTLWDLVRMYGLWLFILLSAGLVLARRYLPLSPLTGQNAPLLFVLGLLVGILLVGVGMLSYLEVIQLTAPWLLLPLVAGAGWLAWRMRRCSLATLLPLLWGSTALALCLGVEIFVIRGDVGRMNTVFKFGLHAWILFALASAVALPWVWRKAAAPEVQPLGWVWHVAALLLLAASLVYPLTATPARLADRFKEGLPHTLDGAVFMRSVEASENGQNFALAEDYEAIAWMQQNISGTPIILEAHLPSYRWAGRVATYTGLPTLLGWEWHQVQQRNAVNAGTVIANRQQAIRQIFEELDADATLERLRLYGIEYVYVGGVERAIYDNVALGKFDTLVSRGALEVFYTSASGDTRIYRVLQPGTPTVLTNDLPVVPPSLDTPPPLMLDQPVGDLPVVNEYGWNAWASASSWAALLVWLLALYVLLLLGLPLAVLIFGGWRDSGFIWARLIGLLLLGYAVWLPTSLGLWYYNAWGLAGGTLLVLALNAGVVRWMGRPVAVPAAPAVAEEPAAPALPAAPEAAEEAPQRAAPLVPDEPEKHATPDPDEDAQVFMGEVPAFAHTDVLPAEPTPMPAAPAEPTPAEEDAAAPAEEEPAETTVETTADAAANEAPAEEAAEAPPMPLERSPFGAGLGVLGGQLGANWRNILLSEGLFLLSFLLFVGLRALNPDLWHPIWGGEKPMEFGFLNAILRSPVMPPYDPFFSGGYINYYYYGIYLVSLPIKATGIAPALAYNLVVPLIFTFTLTGGYALVAHLTGRVRYGLAGAAFLALLGNLASVIPYNWARGIEPVLEALGSVGLAQVGARLGDWYVGPSRVIPNTINEFPFWSFLFADLHPHMIALPIGVLAIAAAYQQVTAAQQFGTPGAALPLYLFSALLLGTLAVTNSWDYPTYALLMAAAIVGAAWRMARGVPWLALLRAGLLVGAVAVGGLALFSPFFDHFHAFVKGVAFVQEGTSTGAYLLVYGLFLAVLLPVIFGILWRLLHSEARRLPLGTTAPWLLPLLACLVLPVALVLLAVLLPAFGLSIWLSVLIVVGLVLYLERRMAVQHWFVLVLALLAWAVSLGIELIYIQDHMAGGEWYRMNTVFKFGVQIWTLLALAAAASLPVLVAGLGRLGRRLHVGPRLAQAVGLVLLGVLVAAAAVFPLVGTASRVANRFPVSFGPTLDGLAFLREARFDYDCRAYGGCQPGTNSLQLSLAPDAEAIAWLNEHIAGTPVVAQSSLWFYRAYGIRVAANTGLPTIVSALHVDEQRDPALATMRDNDVRTLYTTTDTETTLRLLARYRVDYVYVGAIERAFYGPEGLQKFDDMVGTYLDAVYEAPGAAIYQVNGIPASYAGPAPYDFAAEEELAPPPEPLPVTEEEAPAAPAAEQPAPAAEPAVPEVQALAEELAADPTNASLAYGLGERYREQGRLDDAARVLEVAALANPQDIGLNHLWGDVLSDAGRYDEAEAAYRGVAEAVPTAGNWNKLATGLMRWGALNKAEEALQEAIALEPEAPEPHFRLGQVYYEQGQDEEARAALQRYLELAPDGYLANEARLLLEDLQ